ncbi:TIR domain-containing protein [Sphingomonas sp. NSE70-1]|uniref:TIR domain-containing protein n=1 Tax=Sphingomonas caseinilyticus TaxID=2908205 RepID=A0ABT0RSQ8_9SPHN|nr:TIR domain-containing protein [Sphingomonas caseinilyticus]MCL6698034.1 TIR domain-containing protein [Sphingomonas caseinilyticus]
MSYDRDDSDKARTIVLALESAGHSVWWDRHIKGGAQYSKVIEQALMRADAVVVLWSEHSIDSAWVRDEAASGRDSGRLVPVTVDGSQAPLGFRQYQTIDLSGSGLRASSTGMRALQQAVDELAPGTGEVRDIPPQKHAAPAPALARRTLVVGGAVAAIGATGFLLLRAKEPSNPPEVEALFGKARQAWTQGSGEGNAQAIGLYRRATTVAPDNADAWGFLGVAYADRAHWFVTASERTAIWERAHEAGQRALQLDPRNAYGRSAVAYARPMRGNWLLMEREFRRGVSDQPGKWLVSFCLGWLLTLVGRLSEASELFEKIRDEAPPPNQYRWHIQALWGSGKTEEADRVLEEADSIYRTHEVIWQTRFDMLLTGGQPGAALAMTQDPANKPASIPPEELALQAAVARALVSNAPSDREAAKSALMQQSREAAWLARMAIQYLGMTGFADEAFQIADAYYFSRGFSIPDRASATSRPDVTLDARDTRFLFLPTMRALRADARFEGLVNEIGLTRYWQQAGTNADYRRA